MKLELTLQYVKEDYLRIMFILVFFNIKANFKMKRQNSVSFIHLQVR